MVLPIPAVAAVLPAVAVLPSTQEVALSAILASLAWAAVLELALELALAVLLEQPAAWIFLEQHEFPVQAVLLPE